MINLKEMEMGTGGVAMSSNSSTAKKKKKVFARNLS
jgi:hypothetical protein